MIALASVLMWLAVETVAACVGLGLGALLYVLWLCGASGRRGVRRHAKVAGR